MSEHINASSRARCRRLTASLLALVTGRLVRRLIRAVLRERISFEVKARTLKAFVVERCERARSVSTGSSANSGPREPPVGRLGIGGFDYLSAGQAS